MKIKSTLILSLLLITSYGFSEGNSSIYNTWILEKIVNKGADVNYMNFEKNYTVIITTNSISYAGSCTPCTITDFTIDKSTIAYGEGAACVPACCFFNSPQETLMHQPNFEGTFILRDNKLTITSGSKVYYFKAQVNL